MVSGYETKIFGIKSVQNDDFVTNPKSVFRVPHAGAKLCNRDSGPRCYFWVDLHCRSTEQITQNISVEVHFPYWHGRGIKWQIL